MSTNTGENTGELFFNLLDEPWVLARNKLGDVEELSLIAVFQRAHELDCLEGELPTQDAAVLRLMLAILFAVFSRSDEKGRWSPLDTTDNARTEALRRWRALWDTDQLPIELLTAYLESYRERFWLVHPTWPFYQVVGLTKATEYPAAKLIGDISESNNKPRQFPIRSGIGKERLEPNEAARWLLHLIGYDDNSGKPSERSVGMPSVGVGWLGKLGLVYSTGKSLKETLLLNLVLLDQNGVAFPERTAYWELPAARTAERIILQPPESPIETLTVQSRRIELSWQDNYVTGYKLIGGDAYERENCFAEQMTLWYIPASKQAEVFMPKRHNAERQMWRDFASLLAQGQSRRPAGIINWLTFLRDGNKLNQNYVRLAITGAQYGDKDFFIDGIVDDSLELNADILSDIGSDWVVRIVDEVDNTDKCVWALGQLAGNIAKASGNDDKNSVFGISATARSLAFSELDHPFRGWLNDLNPTDDNIEEQIAKYRELLRSNLFRLGEELVAQSDLRALLGREKTDGTSVMSAPQAFSLFKNTVFKILRSEEVEANE